MDLGIAATIRAKVNPKRILNLSRVSHIQNRIRSIARSLPLRLNNPLDLLWQLRYDGRTHG